MCAAKKIRGNVSSERFEEELLKIFEEKLAQLSPGEQDSRIEAFSKKAAKLYHESCTTTPRHVQTQASSLVARSRE
jgi:hypothetical protein